MDTTQGIVLPLGVPFPQQRPVVENNNNKNADNAGRQPSPSFRVVISFITPYRTKHLGPERMTRETGGLRYWYSHASDKAILRESQEQRALVGKREEGQRQDITAAGLLPHSAPCWPWPSNMEATAFALAPEQRAPLSKTQISR